MPSRVFGVAQGAFRTMPVGYQLHSFPAAISWFMGSLAIRGDDVYAVIGLVAAVVVLSLWVVIENLRLTRWRATEGADTMDDADAISHAGTNGSSGPASTAEADMSPVRARAEWLLDDNTLVRTGAVTREALRKRAPLTLQPSPVIPSTPAAPAAPVATSGAQPTMKAKRPLRI